MGYNSYLHMYVCICLLLPPETCNAYVFRLDTLIKKSDNKKKIGLGLWPHTEHRFFFEKQKHTETHFIFHL